MAPITLSDFALNVDIDGFYEIFWEKSQWFEEFLSNKLKDLSVDVGDWAPSPEQPNAQVRTVRSYHPSKISFPGLPSHAEVGVFIYYLPRILYDVVTFFVLFMNSPGRSKQLK